MYSLHTNPPAGLLCWMLRETPGPRCNHSDTRLVNPTMVPVSLAAFITADAVGETEPNVIHRCNRSVRALMGKHQVWFDGSDGPYLVQVAPKLGTRRPFSLPWRSAKGGRCCSPEQGDVSWECQGLSSRSYARIALYVCCSPTSSLECHVPCCLVMD